MVKKICQSGVIEINISDHLITFCTRKTTKEYTGKRSMLRISSLKCYLKRKFKENTQ